MTDHWRFGPFSRLILFTVMFAQWTLTMLLTMLVVTEHGDVTAGDAAAFELAYWVVVGGLLLGFFAMPVASYTSKYAPKAYRTIKTKVTQ